MLAPVYDAYELRNAMKVIEEVFDRAASLLVKRLYIFLLSPRSTCIICVCKVCYFLCHTNYHLCSQSLNDTPLLLLFTYCSLFWANPAHSISPLLFYKYVLIRSSTYIHVYLNSCTVYNSVKWFGENIEEICLGLGTSGSGIMWQ